MKAQTTTRVLTAGSRSVIREMLDYAHHAMQRAYPRGWAVLGQNHKK